jgi:phosphate starvation-inducible PhoH-like protein
MNIRSLVLTMLCCTRILPVHSFKHIQTRGFVRTPVLMRSKKKTPVAVSSYTDDVPSRQRNKKMSPSYEPRSNNQKSYVDNLQDWNIPIVLGIGPAGCGKTMFACLQAIHELKSGSVDKIILTRPIVPVEEEELGFLPGNLVKKMDPWTRPVFDIFSEFYQQRDIENMIHCGILEISPLAYMRGRTFKRAFIIADEMQNSTPNQMLMLTTRIGDYSKMVITGDLKQSDRSADNGLLDFMDKLNFHKQRKDYVEGALRIEMTQMEKGDVQRSPIVSQILDIYNKTVDGCEAMVYTDDVKTVDSFHYANGNNDAALIPLRDLPTKHFNVKDWLI